MDKYCVVVTDNWSNKVKVYSYETETLARDNLVIKYVREILNHDCCDEEKTFYDEKKNFAQFSDDGFRVIRFTLSEIKVE